MADLRVPSTRPPATPAAPSPGKAETVKAAQRAFFDAALAKTAAPPTAPVAVRAQPVTAASVPSLQAPAPTAPPGRLLRPGSLVDVKI